jgi:hypothetical protein
MAPPTFTVFVDPLAKFSDLNPPDPPSSLIERLVRYGFNPLVDSRGQPFASTINSLFGFVVIEGEKGPRACFCSDYVSGKVLCLQFYTCPLERHEEEYILSHCAHLYGLQEVYVYDNETNYDYLREYISPAPQQVADQYSDFLGNTIRMYNDHIFVVDPKPVENENKREIDEVY